MNINSKAAYKAYMDSIRDHALPEHFNNKGIDIKEVTNSGMNRCPFEGRHLFFLLPIL